MKTNTEYYSSELDISVQKFLSISDLHPVLDEFRTIVTGIDIETNSAKIASQLENNIKEYWANPEFRKENFDTNLDAILLEYNSMDEIDSKVYAYGLIDMKSQLEDFQNSIQLKDYDFCDDFQSLPAFNLSITNDLYKTHWESLEDNYPNLEIYFEKGWNELMDIYKNAIYISSTKAINLLVNKSLLNRLKMKNNFSVLIQEHDCNARLLMKKRA